MNILSILLAITLIEWAIIAGVLIVVSYFGFSAKNLIAATSVNLSVPIDGSVTLTVFLVRKGWFSSKLKPTSGVLNHLSSSLITISPTSPVTTNSSNRSVTLKITGIAKGTGTITLNGKSRGGKRSHDSLVVKYTVS